MKYKSYVKIIYYFQYKNLANFANQIDLVLIANVLMHIIKLTYNNVLYAITNVKFVKIRV